MKMLLYCSYFYALGITREQRILTATLSSHSHLLYLSIRGGETERAISDLSQSDQLYRLTKISKCPLKYSDYSSDTSSHPVEVLLYEEPVVCS